MSDFDREQCVKVMWKLHNKIKDRVENTIYHYTNVEGFKGIIQSKEIRMTNALFVNDKTELRSSIKGDDIFKSVRFQNPDLFDVFKKKQQVLKDETVKDFYLASFSKNKNSLDQFRAYGNYCCIGFDVKKLKKNRFNLFRCVYNKTDIKKWIIRKDKFKEWNNKCFDNERGESYRRGPLYNIEFAIQAKSKNKHFKSEEEIRLLAVSNSSWGMYTNSPEMFCDQPSIYFRNHNMFNAPVPYVKFFIPKHPTTSKELEGLVKNKSQLETKQIIRDIEKNQKRELLPINEVIIGPMQHQEEAVIATKIFLRENGHDKVNVIPSDIPFRG